MLSWPAKDEAESSRKILLALDTACRVQTQSTNFILSHNVQRKHSGVENNFCHSITTDKLLQSLAEIFHLPWIETGRETDFVASLLRLRLWSTQPPNILVKVHATFKLFT